MAPSQVAGVPIDEWLEACRRMVAAQRELYERTSGIAARTQYAGIGEGGDRSLVIDREAEDIVFGELERLHDAGGNFTAVSEERGEVAFGGGEGLVVIDPIDGSLNARRTLPSFALSVAVATGPSMADVELALRLGLRRQRGVRRPARRRGATRRRGAPRAGPWLRARGRRARGDQAGADRPDRRRARGQGLPPARDRIARPDASVTSPLGDSTECSAGARAAPSTSPRRS